VAGLVASDGELFIHDGYRGLGPAPPELPGGGQPDDARTDDDEPLPAQRGLGMELIRMAATSVTGIRRGEMVDTGAVLPATVAGLFDDYLDAARQVAPGQLAAVYAVGSLARGDFSVRQSNLDLVVVAEPRLEAGQVGRLAQASRGLRRAHRNAEVWYASWEDLDAGGPGANGSTSGTPLATPLTRAILRHDPMALLGPDWPVVGQDPDALQRWSAEQLRALAAASHGLLVLRRAVAPLVLEAARLAQVAITGRVFSKSAAGEAVMPIVSTRQKRILTDAVGYRRGAQTSMYWGPFERKYDALTLVRDLLEAATSAGGAPARP
jgi:hypothetical protein